MPPVLRTQAGRPVLQAAPIQPAQTDLRPGVGKVVEIKGPDSGMPSTQHGLKNLAVVINPNHDFPRENLRLPPAVRPNLSAIADSPRNVSRPVLQDEHDRDPVAGDLPAQGG